MKLHISIFTLIASKFYWTNVIPGYSGGWYELDEYTDTGSWRSINGRIDWYINISEKPYPIIVRSPGTYQYRLRACNSYGCSGYYNKTVQLQLPVATFSPILHSGLSVSSILARDGNFRVNWGHCTLGYLSRYELHEKKDAGPWTLAYSGSAHSYTASAKSSGRYRYKARACNNFGCSPYTNEQVVNVAVPTSSPGVPASLSVSPSVVRSSYTSYILSWGASELGAPSRYELSEKQDDGTWSNIYSGNSNSYQIWSRPTGAHNYRVRACNDIGCSAYTAEKMAVVAPSQEYPQEFHFLDTRSNGESPNVYALSDQTKVVINGTFTNLNMGQRAPVVSMNQGAIIYSNLPLAIGSAKAGTDIPIPNDYSGYSFVIPLQRGTHRIFIKNISSRLVSFTFSYGTTSRTERVPANSILELSVSSNSGSATISNATGRLLVSHRADSTKDVYPVPPAARELVGIRTRNGYVGTLSGGTVINAYASNGTSSTINLGARGKSATLPGLNGSQGRASSIRLVANKPIAAISQDDGDGQDSTTFLPLDMLANRFVLPVDTQYVAVACVGNATPITVRLKSSTGTLLQSATCTSGRSNTPGKAYLGNSSNTTRFAAGSVVTASGPIYLVYEPSATNDEHNLIGVMDTDLDELADTIDTDDDGDGVPDISDDFPLDSTRSKDTDGDGIDDKVDTDIDGDGQTNVHETRCGSDPRLASSKSLDQDSDNLPDCVDYDDDGDGLIDPPSRPVGTYTGDINADGLTDIFVSSSTDVGSILLQQQRDKSFSVKGVWTPNQVDTVTGWLKDTSLRVVAGDINQDSKTDIIVVGIEQWLRNGRPFDQIVFAANGTVNGVTTTSIDQDLESFISEVFEWLSNRNYFVQNTPLISISIPIRTGLNWIYTSQTYSGFAASRRQCFLDHARCYTGRGYLMNFYSDQHCEELARQGISCNEYGWHVLGATIFTTIVTVRIPDYSVHNQNSTDTVGVLDPILNGEITPERLRMIDEILEDVMGVPLGEDQVPTDGTDPNSKDKLEKRLPKRIQAIYRLLKIISIVASELAESTEEAIDSIKQPYVFHYTIKANANSIRQSGNLGEYSGQTVYFTDDIYLSKTNVMDRLSLCGETKEGFFVFKKTEITGLSLLPSIVAPHTCRTGEKRNGGGTERTARAYISVSRTKIFASILF